MAVALTDVAGAQDPAGATAHIDVLGTSIAFDLRLPPQEPASAAQPGPTPAPETPAPPERSVSFDARMASITNVVPDFGGMFINSRRRTVNVFLTPDPGASTVERRRRIVKTMKAIVRRYPNVPLRYVRVRSARFDFEQLHRWQQRLESLLGERGVRSTDVEERSNVIEIGVRNLGVKRRVRLGVRQLGVPLRAVRIRRERLVTLDKTLQDVQRPMLGGVQITNSNGGTCSMGIPAYSFARGTWGFVTNSHCTISTGGVANDTRFYQPYRNGRSYGGNPGTDLWDAGYEVLDPLYPRICDYYGTYYGCRWSDSAFVEWPSWFNAQTQGDGTRLWQHGAIAGPALNSLEYNAGGARASLTQHEGARWVVGIDYYPVSGQYVEKVGRTTGRTKGQITETCKTSLAKDGLIRRCSYFASYASGPGDSGSPVYYYNPPNDPGSAVLVGLNWGSGPRGAVFSPITGVEHELGNLYFCRLEVATSSC